MTQQTKILEQQLALESLLLQQRQNSEDDEIDLKELWTAIWAGKKLIIAITFVFAIAAIAYAIHLPNIYKSTVLLAPVEQDKQGGGLSALASKFGGLASLAGVNLGGSSIDKTTIALEILKGKAFIGEFVNKYQLKPVFMATNGWNLTTNSLTYDSELYNEKTKKWVRDVSPPKTTIPSDLEFYHYFIKNNLAVSKDKETSLITVSVKHYSPYVAKNIVDKLIIAINNKMKQADILQAEKSIQYLTKALSETDNADMQKIFYQLIEQQQQTKMLASVKEQYVFKTVDPAVVAEKKDSPKRALIVVLATMLGGMLSVLIVLIRYFSNKDPQQK